MKLTGENKEKGERTFAAASGDALCPVKAMRFIFETYGLFNPLRAGEPIFASMRADGSRYYAHPESSTGATMITSREVNEGIAVLCSRAKVDRFTSRATRHGQSSDMDAAGASDSLANVALVRQAMGQYLQAQRPSTELQSLRLALLQEQEEEEGAS